MTKNPIMMTKPTGVAAGQNCLILIHELPHGGYRVGRARFKSGSQVTWKFAGNPQPDDIVVHLPQAGNAILHKSDFPATINGDPGVYQYGLFVSVGGDSYAVEGNSPPEMIIE